LKDGLEKWPERYTNADGAILLTLLWGGLARNELARGRLARGMYFSVLSVFFCGLKENYLGVVTAALQLKKYM